MKPVLVRTCAVALIGVRGHVVTVETHVGPGLVTFTLVGLPGAAVKESRERVRAALGSCGVEWFNRRITVNLSPAEIPKNGTSFDLAIALGLLGAHRIINADDLESTVCLAELGLDGTLKPVRGVLPAVAAAAEAGYRRVIVAPANANEARLIPGIRVDAYHHLSDVADALGARLTPVAGVAARDSNDQVVSPTPVTSTPSPQRSVPLDLADVCGQNYAIEGMITAAAGGHHLLMMGEPGSGKTMLAERLPGILPPLSAQDAIEATTIHSVAGTLDSDATLMTTPPIEAPHHGASMVAICGGGSGLAKPGAVSLAHTGVLFLDEATEFSPRALDALRQPLESGSISIYRAAGKIEYPARFQLVLASNPCPCGHLISRTKRCRCSSVDIRRYQARLSGPLLDRIDIQLTMTSPSPAECDQPPQWTTQRARDLVGEARERAEHRWREYSWSLNAHIPTGEIAHLPVADEARELLTTALNRGKLSMRAVHRILRVAMTIADLRGSDSIERVDLTVALSYRKGFAHDHD